MKQLVFFAFIEQAPDLDNSISINSISPTNIFPSLPSTHDNPLPYK